MDKTTEILTALEDIGDSPTAVAWFLQDCGIVGEPSEPTKCPVAAYLRLRFGVRARGGRSRHSNRRTRLG